MLQHYFNGVGGGVFGFVVVEVEFDGHDAVLDADLALGVFFDAVEEESFNTALVQDNLLEATDIWDCVWGYLVSLEHPFYIGCQYSPGIRSDRWIVPVESGFHRQISSI
jgi:hypothetical protein